MFANIPESPKENLKTK
jgi:hypothetical protein